MCVDLNCTVVCLADFLSSLLALLESWGTVEMMIVEVVRWHSVVENNSNGKQVSIIYCGGNLYFS